MLYVNTGVSSISKRCEQDKVVLSNHNPSFPKYLNVLCGRLVGSDVEYIACVVDQQ